MKATSFRLPDLMTQNLRLLAEHLGMTQTQVVVIAIDRMAKEYLPRRKREGGAR